MTNDMENKGVCQINKSTQKRTPVPGFINAILYYSN